MDNHFKSLLSNKKVYRITTSFFLFIIAVGILFLAYLSVSFDFNGTIQQAKDFIMKLTFLIRSLFVILPISAAWILLSVKQYSNSKWLLFYLIGALITVLRIRYVLSNVTSSIEYSFNIYSSLIPFAIGGILSLVITIIVNSKLRQNTPAKNSLANR
ncbi:MAG TPA: hypothetical protein VHP54_03925 [Caproiciproducens sp.]|nr:hypothetical protein [Caproiciproducens sp.]